MPIFNQNLNLKKMRKYIFALLVFALPLFADAQVFRFGFGDDFFGDDFFGPQRRQQENVVKPEYDGDKEDMEDFMKENFKNPVNQREVEGKIIIACIINEKGKVIETHVVRGLKEDFNKEAQRVAAKMRFKPAKRGKEKVKSRYDVTFPIRKGRLSFLNLRTTDV